MKGFYGPLREKGPARAGFLATIIGGAPRQLGRGMPMGEKTLIHNPANRKKACPKEQRRGKSWKLIDADVGKTQRPIAPEQGSRAKPENGRAPKRAPDRAAVF